MTTFDLTEKEERAAYFLVRSCVRNMGGKRPADLEHDEYTWVDAQDLVSIGYTRHEAAGLFSSLADKGFIFESEPKEWAVNTPGWQWFDTIWDKYNAELEKQ